MKHIIRIVAVSFALLVAGCATQKNSQTSSSADSGVYTIQAGDTFLKIAKIYHLTIRQLEDLNPDVMPAHLKIGQELYVLPQAGK
jgi:LysM repeat protein